MEIVNTRISVTAQDPVDAIGLVRCKNRNFYNVRDVKFFNIQKVPRCIKTKESAPSRANSQMANDFMALSETVSLAC